MPLLPLSIPAVLPSWATCVSVRFDGSLEPDAMFAGPLPETILKSVPKRQREFAAGRYCALAALRAAGAGSVTDIPIGALQAPVWPAGYVGSISHCEGVAAAVVAPTEHARSLGLDIEPLVPLETIDSLQARVAVPREIHRVSATGLDRAAVFTVLFSAKEALFKCLAPLVGRYFDFLDAEAVRASNDSVVLELVRELAPDCPRGLRLTVRHSPMEECIVTGVVLQGRR